MQVILLSGNSMDSLIRESIQNSIDVKIKNDKPLKVIFRKHTISKDSLPNINILMIL